MAGILMSKSHEVISTGRLPSVWMPLTLVENRLTDGLLGEINAKNLRPPSTSILYDPMRVRASLGRSSEIAMKARLHAVRSSSCLNFIVFRLVCWHTIADLHHLQNNKQVGKSNTAKSQNAEF